MSNVKVEKKIESSRSPGNINDYCEVTEEGIMKKDRQKER